MLDENLDPKLRELFINEIADSIFYRTVHGQPLTEREVQLFDKALIHLSKRLELKLYVTAKLIEYHMEKHDHPVVEEAY